LRPCRIDGRHVRCSDIKRADGENCGPGAAGGEEKSASVHYFAQ
jgi:hypothetical protein